MRKKEQPPAEQQMVPYRKLVFQALPEMWGFHLIAALVLGIPTWVLTRLMAWVSESTGEAITTANMGKFLLSWRTPVLLVLGAALVLCFIVTELFAQIYLSDDILGGRPAGIRKELFSGVRAVKRFFSPSGVLVLLFIFLAVPLCGVGFSISLTKKFEIPKFIMDVVYATPYYIIPYLLLLLFFTWLAYRYCFTLHAVLLDNMSCQEGRKVSAGIVKQHRKEFLLGLLKLVVVLGLVKVAASLLLDLVPTLLVEKMGADLPHDLVVNFFERADTTGFTQVEVSVMVYRVLAAFVVLLGGYLDTVVALLCGAYFILRFTRYYRDFTSETPAQLWPERPKKSRYLNKFGLVLLVTLLVAGLSLLIGLGYDDVIRKEDRVKIIAHRAGGTMASENSLEGLHAAIEHGCYASEIDIHRTLDGYYIINHDNDFKRLTGVAKAPKDMTLAEIMELRIKDTTGSGAELKVPTLEEMLDIIKGKEKLFIELKGATADRQMVDDVVKMVREKDCVEDAVLISLEYDVIDYAETTYPEFVTGVLFFGGLGDVSKLNCDLLIMEEEMGTSDRINQIHDAGKMAIVWTVNTEESMHHFLQSSCDAVITDEVVLAEEVQAELDAHTEMELIQDRLDDFWTR